LRQKFSIEFRGWENKDGQACVLIHRRIPDGRHEPLPRMTWFRTRLQYFLTLHKKADILYGMKIFNLLHTKLVFLDIPLPDKEAVLRFVAEAFATRGIVKDADLLYEGIKEREETMSTGIGGGIGIPHAISGEAEAPAILILRLAQPLDFGALDGFPVDVVVALVVPENRTELHLQILAALARICQAPGFRRAVRDARDPASLFEEIRRLEEDIPFHS